MLNHRGQQDQQHHFHVRLKIFTGVVIIVFGLIILRFYHLQIIKGRHYRELSENNRLALIEDRAPRGIMYDRNRKVLVANRPSFNVSLVLEDVKDLRRTEDVLVKALDLDLACFQESIRKVGHYRQFQPIRIKDDISRDKLAYVEAMKFQYPGLNVNVEPRRFYPRASFAAHLLGYVGEVDQAELIQGRGVSCEAGDFIGKLGLEKEFNEILRGIDGGQQVEIDSLGRRLRVLNSQEPLPGYNLLLTLDQDVQRAAEDALGDVRGAVVVMDPASGEILAAVSHPAFDPNLFATGISVEEWNAIAKNERHPLQNRVIQSQYPPGSVYKLVTATAALQEGIITPETTFWCGGGMKFGDRVYHCWKKEGHGRISLHRAIVESCDVYFYQAGLKTGIDKIARCARELGLGQRTGLGLPGEWPGLVPDSAWKRKVRGESWYQGETLSAAIGQGYNLLTPMQMAVMISALANGGHIWRPLLVKAVLAPDGRVMEEMKPEEIRQAAIRPEVLEAVRKGMWGVVNEPTGTGWQAKLKSLDVAGKTGTAQVVKMRQESEDGSQDYLPENLRDHAWFGCFAPFGAPQAVVVVLVEHGGHGGSVSAPVARKVLQAMFEKEKEKGTEVALQGAR